MVTRTPWITCNTDYIVCIELYSAVLMLELLTKEYIVASILAWLQTLYFLFKVRRGHEIKKKTTSRLFYFYFIFILLFCHTQ